MTTVTSASAVDFAILLFWILYIYSTALTHYPGYNFRLTSVLNRSCDFVMYDCDTLYPLYSQSWVGDKRQAGVSGQTKRSGRCSTAHESICVIVNSQNIFLHLPVLICSRLSRIQDSIAEWACIHDGAKIVNTLLLDIVHLCASCRLWNWKIMQWVLEIWPLLFWNYRELHSGIITLKQSKRIVCKTIQIKQTKIRWLQMKPQRKWHIDIQANTWQSIYDIQCMQQSGVSEVYFQE